MQATQGRKVQGKRLDLQDSLGGALEERLETNAPHRGATGPQTTSKTTSSTGLAVISKVIRHRVSRKQDTSVRKCKSWTLFRKYTDEKLNFAQEVRGDPDRALLLGSSHIISMDELAEGGGK